MPRPVSPSIDDITVTTATRTPDDVRASLGAEATPAPKAEETPTTETATPAAPAAAVPDAAALEREANSERPDPDISEAARTLRAQTSDAKLTALREDLALYEANIRQLGGTVPPLEARTYADKKAEIDHLNGRRGFLNKLLSQTLREKPAKPTAPPAAEAPPAAATPPAAAVPPEPKFEFSTWEKYQVEHPEADYTEYLDARSDARDAFTEQVRTERAQREAAVQAQAKAVETYAAGVAAIKSEHADYDEVTAKVTLDHLGPDRLAGLQRLLLREGANGPRLTYYLATHPEDVTRLAQSQSPMDLMQVFGEIRYAARVAAKPAAAAPAPAAASASAVPASAAAPPAKPKPEAPAPLTPVPGTASHTRTLQQIADDSDDADAYIERRKAELGIGRPRRAG